jgi:hypothetical protein
VQGRFKWTSGWLTRVSCEHIQPSTCAVGLEYFV